jgi:hypothetical protein
MQPRLAKSHAKKYSPIPSWSFLWGLQVGHKRLVLPAKFGSGCCVCKQLRLALERPDQKGTLWQRSRRPHTNRRGTWDALPALPFRYRNRQKQPVSRGTVLK